MMLTTLTLLLTLSIVSISNMTAASQDVENNGESVDRVSFISVRHF